MQLERCLDKNYNIVVIFIQTILSFVLSRKTGKINCSLVIAESHIAPVKYTSIPRLE